MDLWALLAMPSISTQRAKAVQSLLKRKFADGHAGHAWLKKGLLRHEVIIPEQWREHSTQELSNLFSNLEALDPIIFIRGILC